MTNKKLLKIIRKMQKVRFAGVSTSRQATMTWDDVTVRYIRSCHKDARNDYGTIRALDEEDGRANATITVLLVNFCSQQMTRSTK